MTGMPPPIREALLIDEAALSTWGKRVRKLQSWGFSLGEIGRQVKCDKTVPWRMATDPNYEPHFGLGARFNRFFIKQARAQLRKRLAEQRNEPSACSMAL